ncbi:rhodanese-like/PpiC domain-containing protein 12, chloroplastic [Carica papaya]|uniref:rhodanese-like/PpiC domain-containing protein 12, chloroplastic n=1 Tax=Carica papaya TaxID=3649 RepID=UPI000B8CCE89|nr:rhodanese-like/PpiC domain-containing protein 12, chloroplastic [Carica papaya]
MLRATHHLFPVASPKLSVIRQPLLPAPILSSLSRLYTLSPFVSSSLSSLPSSLRPAPHAHLPSSTFRRVPSLLGARHFPRATVSLSGGSDSGSIREIMVQHLLVKEDDLKLLLELEKRIADGEDMSDLAVEYSICQSKERGGMLGWVKQGQLVPEFEEAAFSAPLTKVIRCKSKSGWHLLQVLSEREGLQEIQVDELHVKMQDPKFLEEAQLIDVREPDEIALASLPAFQVFPLRQFGTWGPEMPGKFDPEKDIYVMCHHGVRSLQVAKWLQSQGFKRVFNVAGGIHAYALKADPSIPTY